MESSLTTKCGQTTFVKCNVYGEKWRGFTAVPPALSMNRFRVIVTRTLLGPFSLLHWPRSVNRIKLFLSGWALILLGLVLITNTLVQNRAASPNR
jgi:hypothetical protein